MHQSFRSVFVLASLAVFCLGGCASYRETLPETYRVKRTDVPVFPYGCWAEVEANANNPLQGEFIAVSSDSLWILSPINRTQSVAKDSVRSMAVFVHRDESVSVKNYTTGMISSTLTHGWFLVLTLPTWLITRLVLVNQTQNMVGVLYYPSLGWEELADYSRFPQGLPKGLNPHRLNPIMHR